MRLFYITCFTSLNYICLVFIGLIFIYSPAFAEQTLTPQQTLTLNDATQLALQNNSQISLSLRGREIGNAEALQAATRPNPTLSTQVQDLRSQNRIAQLIISQQIETAGKRDMRIKAANAGLSIVEADITIAKTETSAKVYGAFYQVLAAQQAQSLAIELLQIATTSKETTAKRVLAGKVSPVEETKAKVAEAGLKIELATANQQLANAKQHLSSLWNTGLLANKHADFTAIGVLENFTNLPSLNDLNAQLAESPRIKKATLDITQKQALTQIEQSKKTPDITVSLGAQRNEELGGLTQAIIGLSIPIPIFDKNLGNLQGAKAREYQAADEKALLENQLQTDLTDAYSRRQLQVEAANTYKQDILIGAKSANDAARKGFEYGKFSFLEVLDAQRTLFMAKTQYIQTLVLARLAEADIQKILGKNLFAETIFKETVFKETVFKETVFKENQVKETP